MDARSEVFNCDCMEYMRSLPDKYFQLAIADPPYGLDKKSIQGSGKLKNRTLNKHDMSWDIRPSMSFFKELQRISKHVIIWGGNYFDLGRCRCFICWDKMQVWPNFSQCEFAFTDYDMPSKHVRLSNRGGDADSVDWHPTSKPVDLYLYCLQTFAKEGDSIFDPMMGSQSSRIAAYKMGFDYVGCELNKEYFDNGCLRFERECQGIVTTKDGKKYKQTTLFD